MSLIAGYKRTKIEKMSYDLNPGSSLLTDWIVSSGNTALSIDLLVSYLEQIGRADIADMVLRGQGMILIVISPVA